MFDGLKDKLGSFTEDVEDAAETEEAPPDETDANGESTASEAGTADATATEAAAAEDESADEKSNESRDDEPDTGFARKAKSLATGKIVIEEQDLEDPLWELEMALLDSDVSMSVAEAILQRVEAELVGETRSVREGTADVVEDALREALLDVVGVGQFDVEERIARAEKPVTIIFTGVNGVGKTTSIAKVVRWLDERGYSSVVANGDTYRAGANEQLQEHAEALGVECITHEQGGDPTAVIYDAVEYAEAHDVDVVLGDTAGRLHTDAGLMDQLAKIDRVVEPDLTLFVDEAVAGQDAIERAREFDEAAAIDGAILTKADADTSGGAAISIAHVTGKPVLFLGVGQGYEDLERFDPEWLVEELFEE
jgi:fused signal recognition particle receptor